MALDSMKEIFDQMERESIPFWEVVLQADMEERQVTRKQSMAKMLITWQAMEDAADTYTGTRKSVSGLVGGDGIKMRQYAMRGAAMSGGYVCDVIAEALSMAESNACMRRIVAAPTAGACGVLPAVLLPLCNYEEITQHQLLEALYVASGIGAVIAHRACISGAAGGCQAEIGTAAAMAAGALVAIKGGTGAQIGHAVAMALESNGPYMRPCGRPCGGALREAQRNRRGRRGQRRRYGPCRCGEPHTRGRGDRRHGRRGQAHACGIQGDSPGRPCHDAYRSGDKTLHE